MNNSAPLDVLQMTTTMTTTQTVTVHAPPKRPAFKPHARSKYPTVNAPGIPCVLCKDFHAERVEWVKDHAQDRLVQCQRCRACLFSMRDSPEYRRRWCNFLNRLHTPQSRARDIAREQKRAAVAWKAKMQRLRSRALKEAAQKRHWDEEYAVCA